MGFCVCFSYVISQSAIQSYLLICFLPIYQSSIFFVEYQSQADICFPGGKIESGDANAAKAAVREMTEELGVAREQIHILGPLDYVESPVGVTVWPFAAYIDTQDFTLSQGEIDHIFTVPVAWFAAHQPQVCQVEMATRPAPGFPQGLSISGQTEWTCGVKEIRLNCN